MALSKSKLPLILILLVIIFAIPFIDFSLGIAADSTVGVISMVIMVILVGFFIYLMMNEITKTIYKGYIIGAKKEMPGTKRLIVSTLFVYALMIFMIIYAPLLLKILAAIVLAIMTFGLIFRLVRKK